MVNCEFLLKYYKWDFYDSSRRKYLGSKRTFTAAETKLMLSMHNHFIKEIEISHYNRYVSDTVVSDCISKKKAKYWLSTELLKELEKIYNCFNSWNVYFGICSGTRPFYSICWIYFKIDTRKFNNVFPWHPVPSKRLG